MNPRLMRPSGAAIHLEKLFALRRPAPALTLKASAAAATSCRTPRSTSVSDQRNPAMRKLLTLGLAIASLSASAAGAGAAALQPVPEVRPDTLTHVQRGPPPPWAACRRWDRRTGMCLDASWRGRHWRGWSGRRSCRFGHGWWIDSWGRWRRC
jgi:hypothetical protein